MRSYGEGRRLGFRGKIFLICCCPVPRSTLVSSACSRIFRGDFVSLLLDARADPTAKKLRPQNFGHRGFGLSFWSLGLRLSEFGALNV